MNPLEILTIAAGILLIVATLILFVINIIRTPENLRGYYGAMYIGLSIISLIGGTFLIVLGCFGTV
jgi:hypothetical protein